VPLSGGWQVGNPFLVMLRTQGRPAWRSWSSHCFTSGFLGIWTPCNTSGTSRPRLAVVATIRPQLGTFSNDCNDQTELGAEGRHWIVKFPNLCPLYVRLELAFAGLLERDRPARRLLVDRPLLVASIKSMPCRQGSDSSCEQGSLHRVRKPLQFSSEFESCQQRYPISRLIPIS
jgi:hypothetical protein